jgi:hypothetical protein
MRSSWSISGGYFSREETNQTRQIYPIDRGGNMMAALWTSVVLFATHSAGIARFDRAIQYSRALVIDPKGRGALDAPVKPGHDSLVWATHQHHRHHAILPLFCPTAQALISPFPNLGKDQ